MVFIPGDDLGDFGPRRQIKLLVVDEHSEHYSHVQEAAEMYNSEFSVECRRVSDSKEALQVAAEWQPSVVMVDLHIVADSLELLGKIAEQGAAVVATSETRIPELSERLSQYGASGYLIKSESPDDIEALLSYIASIAPVVPPEH
jgi:DNA-binding NarL/FixJ family response regulator